MVYPHRHSFDSERVHVPVAKHWRTIGWVYKINSAPTPHPPRSTGGHRRTRSSGDTLLRLSAQTLPSLRPGAVLGGGNLTTIWWKPFGFFAIGKNNSRARNHGISALRPRASRRVLGVFYATSKIASRRRGTLIPEPSTRTFTFEADDSTGRRVRRVPLG